MGLLGRLADKIAPTDAELEVAGKLPPFSRRARMVKRAVDVPGLSCVEVVEREDAEGKKIGVRQLKPRDGAPQPTNHGVKMLDGKTRVFFSDGSLRSLAKRLTRPEKKALKRRRAQKSA